MNGVDGVVLVVIQITDDPSAERTAPPRSTHVQPGDVSHALIQQGERERLRKTPSSSSTTAWWWWRSVAILQGFAKHRERGGALGRGRAAPVARVKLPCASPLYIGVEGAGFLPSKSIGALAKVGERNPIISLPHRLLSPFFRDLDLIPSGYDLIPSKVGSWCALTRGVGPCPHYPRSCGSPHAGGPHSGTF